MKISIAIVQFLYNAHWPLCLLGRSSSPDWSRGAVQMKGNHNICVYGKLECQQQDTKPLIVVLAWTHARCYRLHTWPQWRKAFHKIQFLRTGKKNHFIFHSSRMQISCQLPGHACQMWACHKLLCIQFDVACQKLKPVRYSFEQVCVSVCSVCMHTYANFCWTHPHIEFLSHQKCFQGRKKESHIHLKLLSSCVSIFLN